MSVVEFVELQTYSSLDQAIAKRIRSSVGADMRTVLKGGASNVKHQPQWCEATYELLANKRSNIQFGVLMRFKCNYPFMQLEKAFELFAESFNAMSPIIDFVLGE